MADGDHILKRYRTSDVNQRLHLFLQYRDLRDAFLEIEASEMSTENSPVETPLAIFFQYVKAVLILFKKKVL